MCSRAVLWAIDESKGYQPKQKVDNKRLSKITKDLEKNIRKDLSIKVIAKT